MTNEREIKIKYAKLKMEANEKYLNELRDIELEVINSNNEIQKPLNEIQKPLKEKPAYIYKPYKAEAIDKKIKQNIATNIFRKNNISDFDLLDKSRSIFADLNDRLFLSIRVAGKNKSMEKGRIWSIKQSEWLDLQTKNSLFIFAIREEKKYVQLSIEEIENILIDSSFSKGNQYIIKGMVSKNYIEFDYDGEIIRKDLISI